MIESDVISRIYNLPLRVVFSTRIRDAQCGFYDGAGKAKAIRKAAPATPGGAASSSG